MWAGIITCTSPLPTTLLHVNIEYRSVLVGTLTCNSPAHSGDRKRVIFSKHLIGCSRGSPRLMLEHFRSPWISWRTRSGRGQGVGNRKTICYQYIALQHAHTLCLWRFHCQQYMQLLLHIRGNCLLLSFRIGLLFLLQSSLLTPGPPPIVTLVSLPPSVLIHLPPSLTPVSLVSHANKTSTTVTPSQSIPTQRVKSPGNCNAFSSATLLWNSWLPECLHVRYSNECESSFNMFGIPNQHINGSRPWRGIAQAILDLHAYIFFKPCLNTLCMLFGRAMYRP